MVCLGRPYHFSFFKDCLPQILLGPFWNNLTQKRLEALPLVNYFTEPICHNLSLFHSFLNFSLIVTKSTNVKVLVNPVMKQEVIFGIGIIHLICALNLLKKYDFLYPDVYT